MKHKAATSAERCQHERSRPGASLQSETGRRLSTRCDKRGLTQNSHFLSYNLSSADIRFNANDTLHPRIEPFPSEFRLRLRRWGLVNQASMNMG